MSILQHNKFLSNEAKKEKNANSKMLQNGLYQPHRSVDSATEHCYWCSLVALSTLLCDRYWTISCIATSLRELRYGSPFRYHLIPVSFAGPTCVPEPPACAGVPADHAPPPPLWRRKNERGRKKEGEGKERRERD